MFWQVFKYGVLLECEVTSCELRANESWVAKQQEERGKPVLKITFSIARYDGHVVVYDFVGRGGVGE